MKITVAFVRDLEKKVNSGEISFSRMVELLNEKAQATDEPEQELINGLFVVRQNNDWCCGGCVFYQNKDCALTEPTCGSDIFVLADKKS